MNNILASLTASKQARANVASTRRCGMRTGNTVRIAPVTIIVGAAGPGLRAPVAHPEPSSVCPTYRKRIEAFAAPRRAAGRTDWPSYNEFIALYGAAPTAADVADYLLSFTAPAAPVATPKAPRSVVAVLAANPHIGVLVRNGAAVYYVNAPRYREASTPAALVRKPRSAAAKARDALYQRAKRLQAKLAKANPHAAAMLRSK